MMRCKRFLAAMLVLAAWGCGGGDPKADLGAPDTPDAAVSDDGPAPDAGDLGPGDPGPADTAEVPGDDGAPDVPMQTRRFVYRAIGGMSMGSQGMTVASHHPEAFDVIAAMGGYIDYRYMGHVFRDKIIAGFCPMDQILANLDHVDDPAVLDCGPVAPDQPYENAWSYNSMMFNDQGGSWQREFYLKVLGSLSYAFGNMLYYNPDNPLTPPGVPLSWLKAPNRCEPGNEIRIGKPLNYNAEYNPEGTYDLITFCDGDSLPPGVTDRKACAADPACRAHLGDYQPGDAHDFPVNFLLAVDYNGNGRRDYAEPVVVNPMERFQDTGVDGCGDDLEDGTGGCRTEPNPGTIQDFNGDNYDFAKNPLGTQGNHEPDDGEPYADNGLDGVAGTGDFGEGDGSFTMSPNFKALIDQDVRSYFRTAPIDEIRSKTWYFEGGIRDPLHAVNSMHHLAAALVARGDEVRVFDNFAGYPTSLAPDMSNSDLLNAPEPMDYAPAKVGRNLLMRYGHPDASAKEILEGDGGHIGLVGPEVMLRATTYFGLAMSRMPDVRFIEDDDLSMPETVWTSFWSEAVQGRRWYVMSLPPGYTDEANAQERYPVALLMPGIGMPLNDTSGTALLIQPLQILGMLPKFLMLMPDGQCAYRRKSDGKRFTGCVESLQWDGLDCVDDACKGPHETCTITKVPTNEMEQECNDGHFFVNHQTDIWGDTTYASQMRYEDGLLEVLAEVDQRFRTRPPEDRQVPADW